MVAPVYVPFSGVIFRNVCVCATAVYSTVCVHAGVCVHAHECEEELTH